jgi:hypothetical protein
MSNQNNDGANALLNRSGTRGIKWEDVGQGVWVTGTILDHGTEVCKKWDAREQKWSNEDDAWDDGQPKMQIVIELQTNLRDPESDDDDGRRSLRSGPYSTRGKRNIIDATRSALAAAGAPGLEHGAQYAIRWVAGAGKSGDPRTFDVAYKRPVTPVPNGNGKGQAPANEDPFAASPAPQTMSAADAF